MTRLVKVLQIESGAPTPDRLPKRSNVFSPTLNSIAKITGPIASMPLIRRPIRGMLNSKKIDPAKSLSFDWRNWISAS